LANGRIYHGDSEICAKRLTQGDSERKPGKPTACDQNIRAID
jgi:hypothetical protein